MDNVVYEEVSLWQEFLHLFSNKTEEWRYCIKLRNMDKLFFIYGGEPYNTLANIQVGETWLESATIMDTYAKAQELKEKLFGKSSKNVEVTVLRPVK